MADPTYKLCDVCGAHTETRIWVAHEWVPCPAGGPKEEGVERLDLCATHLAAALAEVFLRDGRIRDHDQGNRLLAWARDRKKSWHKR